MKSVYIGLVIILAVALAAGYHFMHHAAPPPPPVQAVVPAPPPKPPMGKLQGSILVSDNSGRQIPLGSVTVKAIEEKEIQPFLTQTNLAADATTLSLRLVVSNAQSELDASQKIYDQARHEAETANRYADAAAASGQFSPYDTRPEMPDWQKNMLTRLEHSRHLNEVKGWHDVATNYDARINQLQQVQAQILEKQKLWDQWHPLYLQRTKNAALLIEKSAHRGEEVQWFKDRLAVTQGRLDEWLASRPAGLSFATLPAPIASGTTDPDGKFSLEVPLNRRYALAAIAAGSDNPANDHRWLIWASLEGTDTTSVQLNSSNSTATDNPQSIVRSLFEPL